MTSETMNEDGSVSIFGWGRWWFYKNDDGTETLINVKFHPVRPTHEDAERIAKFDAESIAKLETI